MYNNIYKGIEKIKYMQQYPRKINFFKNSYNEIEIESWKIACQSESEKLPWMFVDILKDRDHWAVIINYDKGVQCLHCTRPIWLDPS